MDQNQVILQFRFATFGDSMLRKMNQLRHQRRFCDVTVRLNQLEVPGHKVVFAAGSSFLRDQFILQQDSSGEVQITMTQEAEVGRQLLLSCYTGQLVFPELELVHYLAVASFLQMSHIVDQCTQALSKFIKPLPPRPPGTGTEVDAEVDVDADAERDRRRRRRKDEGSLQREHQHQHHSPTQTVHKQEDLEDNYVINDNDGEDYDDDDDDDVIIQPATSAQRGGRKEDGDITIVKVESISEAAASDMEEHAAATPSGRFPSGPPPAALRPPEPQHSLINSTVETRGGELLGPATSMSGYPLSPQQAAPGGGAAPPLLLAGRHGHAHGHGHGQGGAHKPPQWYHQCPKCARVFRQLENYANHLKMHKMFMCLLCGKTFTQKGNLHRHMRVHAGIKPFQCKICGKNFTQKCSLLDHLNLHSGDKPHRCNYCDMVFAHKPVLRKHLKQVHGKNSFDNANERSVHDGGLDVGLDGRLLDGGLDVRLDGGLDVRLDGGLDVRLDGTLDFDYGHKTDL